MESRLLIAVVAPPIFYLAAAIFKIYAGYGAGTAIALWSAAIVLLTSLLRNRTRAWLAIASSAACGDFAAQLFMGSDIQVAAAAVTAEILENCLAAASIRYLKLEGRWYQSLRYGLTLFFSSIICALAATIAEATLIYLTISPSLTQNLGTRFTTEALSLLVTLPLILSWTDYYLISHLSARKFFEILSLTTISTSAIYVLFASSNPFLFLAIPILLLVTFRGRLLASTFTVSALYIVVMGFNFGDTDEMIVSYDVGKTRMLLVYYLFILTALLSTVPLGALLVQAERSAEDLRATGAVAEQARREAEAARDRAEAAGRVKSDFLSAMSHELRTPMTAVLGLVDLMSREKLTDKQSYYIENIRNSGRHLLDVISDILDFSRIESGKLEIESIDFDIKPLLDNIYSTFEQLSREKQIEFKIEISNGMPKYLRGDPTRIRQILINLVGNAIKFTERGLVRVVAWSRRGSNDDIRICFEVRDTGIGIAEENRSEIFSAFTQEDRSTARRFGGSGLGLAICKRLVVAMDGEIDFSSTPGFGSIFWFEIPSQEIATEPRLYSSPKIAVRKGGLRILVAEDVAINRDIIGTMLSLEGHDLKFAHDGIEVLQFLEKHAFDLILMDVQMPIMDGIEATQRIRKLAGPARHTPIIALTANVVGRERDWFRAAGMDACIPKPIDWDELNETIARYASGEMPSVNNAVVSDGTDAEPPPTIDNLKLASLRHKLGDDFEKLVSDAFEQAEQACARIEILSLQRGDFSREAHALKGMAGMFGLVQLQRCAETLEAGPPDEFGIEDVGAALRAVITQSRVAACQQGFYRM